MDNLLTICNIESEEHQSLVEDFYYNTESSAPDSNIIESLVHLHLQQSFLLNGLDFIIIDKSKDLKQYDYFVIHKKTNFLFPVQAKSSSCFNRKGQRTKNSKTLKYDENCFVVRLSIEELMTKYESIPVFVIYCGKTYKTEFGPEYRYKVYLILRSELINYMQETQCKHELKVHTNSPFWIAKNANYRIFDQFYEIINNVSTQIQQSLIQ